MPEFQSTENPLGFFQQHSQNADFKWKLGKVQCNNSLKLSLSSGKGSDTLDDGVGPPFDHTMADPTGHYLFVDVNQHEVGW